MPEIAIRPGPGGVVVTINGTPYTKHLTSVELARLAQDFAMAAADSSAWHDKCLKATDDGAFDVV